MLVRFCDLVVHSDWFGRAVLLLILLAAAVVGLETNRALMAAYGPLLRTLDATVLYAFALEALLKIVAGGRGWHRYFADPWNVFDFSIVVVCFLPLGGHYAAVLRLARVLRTLRLVTTLPRLQLLVGALVRSIPSMGYVGFLLLILFYVYGVLGVFLWRDNDPVHFRDLPTAMLTLFGVVTLEGWTNIMYIQMLGSDVHPFDNTSGLPTTPRAAPVVGALYFVSFVLLGTMIMLNLFIGVIMNSMQEAHAEREKQLRERRMAAGGGATLGDELDALEGEMDQLRQRLKAVRSLAQS